MLFRQIELGTTLTSEQAEIIKRKLRNPSDISVVPITVTGNTVIIGVIPEEAFSDQWEHIISKVGYRVHSV